MDGIREDMKSMGFAMTGNEGTVTSEAFGVEVEYHYKEDAHNLTVTVTKKPFLIPCGMLYSRIDQAVARRRPAPDTPHHH